jgi:hypothetical protein
MLTSDGAPLEVRVPSTPATVEEDEYEPEPARRGLMIFGAALAIAAVAGVVFMLGGTKPSATTTPPVIEKKIETPTPPPVVEKKTETPAPSGQAVAPSGEAVAPSGQAVAPSGEAVAPSGQAVAPSGQAATPAVDESEYKKLLEQGRALYAKGQAKKAMVPLEQAVSLKADGDEALVILANCHLDRGNLEKALAAAQLAAAANADNAEAYLVVGAVQQQKGHNPEARSAYEKYLKLAPKGQFAGEIRSILASLH